MIFQHTVHYNFDLYLWCFKMVFTLIIYNGLTLYRDASFV